MPTNKVDSDPVHRLEGPADHKGLRRRAYNFVPSNKLDSDDEDDLSQDIRPKALSNDVDTDSACEDIDEDFNDEDVKPMIPQKVLTMADKALSGLPPRWRNWLTRIISGLSLISGFLILVWLGPGGLLFLTYLVVYTSLNEVLRLGRRVCGVYDNQTINLCWLIIGVLEYFLVGPGCFRAALALLEDQDNPVQTSFESSLKFLIRHHEAICFFTYLSCLTYFVLTMSRTNYLKRYAYLAWTHMGMLFLCISGHLLNIASFSGMIWYVIPMSVITINDIAAYMIGFFFGKTPLIRLSPKKTMEGFIGGGVVTVFLGTLFSHWLSLKPSMFCGVEMCQGAFLAVKDCQPSPLFEPHQIEIFGMSFGFCGFLVHGFVISVFSSLVGPFGGFFASGFKRACKRKNFGSIIPGHGGVLDRCDCMFLMASFIYIYHNILKTEQLI